MIVIQKNAIRTLSKNSSCQSYAPDNFFDDTSTNYSLISLSTEIIEFVKHNNTTFRIKARTKYPYA